MTEQNIEQTRLRDALSDVTRKKRHFLLGTSLIGVTLIKTGLVPSKISGLGIEFKGTDQRALLVIIAFIILYFLAAFIIYAISDFIAWRIAINNQGIKAAVSDYEDSLHSHFPHPDSIDGEIESYRSNLQKKYRIYFTLVTPASIVRALFDFGLPIVVGLYALFLLIFA
jgi:hypothetical protein